MSKSKWFPSEKQLEEWGYQVEEWKSIWTQLELIEEAISRLSNADFWKEFKKHFKISSLGAFGSHCYDLLEAFSKGLEGKVDRAMHKALETKSPRELKLIRNQIEDYLQINGRIMDSLRKQESLMNSLKNGVNRFLKGMGG